MVYYTKSRRVSKSRRRKGGESTNIDDLLERGESPTPPVQPKPISNPPFKRVERPNSPVSFSIPSPRETGPNLVGGRRRRKSKRRKTRKTTGNKKSYKKVKKTYKKKSLFNRIFGI
jgi:hypothetical protein